MPAQKRHPEVDDFIANSSHALAHCLQPLRDIIHGANKDITEQIKWKCPSFCLDGDDRITYNVSRKDQLLVILHTGAKGKGKKPDTRLFPAFPLLDWLAADRASIKISNAEDFHEHQNTIKEIMRIWLNETRV